MRWYLFLLCASLALPVVAQQTLVDSLKPLLSTTKDQQKRAKLYYDLAYASFDINPAATVAYSYQSEALLDTNNIELKAKLYVMRARTTLILGGFDQARGMLDSVSAFLPLSSEQWKWVKNAKVEVYYYLSRALINKDPQQALVYADTLLGMLSPTVYNKMALAYNLKSAAYNILQEYDEALRCIDTSLQYTALLTDTAFVQVMQMQTYNNKGLILIDQSNYEQALIAFDKARTLCDATGNMALKATVLNNLVNVYYYMKDPLPAIEYSRKSMDLIKTQLPFDSLRWYGAQFSMAVMYAMCYEKDSSEAHLDTIDYLLDQMIPYYKLHKEYQQLSHAYLQKSYCYSAREQLPEALQYLHKAEALQDYFVNQQAFRELQQVQGNIYRRVGQLEKSRAIYIHLIDSFEYTDISNKIESLEGGIETALLLKDFELAYRYSEQQRALEDSLVALNSEKVIRDLETKYQTKEIQQQNETLKREQEFAAIEAAQNRRLFYLTIGLAIVLVGLLLLLLQFNTMKSNAQRKELKFQLLRNQMNPHFLFNVLGAIQSFIYAKNPIKAGDFLSSFAILVRAILDNSTQEYIPISKEIEWLKHYVSLQALRFEDDLMYTLDIDPELEQASFMIPPMLIQPIVENALEHGFKDIDYQGQLTIKMTLLDEAVEIIIEDNGIGFDPTHVVSDQHEHRSHARRITKERIALLNRKNARKITFTTTSVPQEGTSVRFYLPFDT